MAEKKVKLRIRPRGRNASDWLNRGRGKEPATFAFEEISQVGGMFKMVHQIESGFDVLAVEEIARDLKLPALAVRQLAKISSSTFNRRQKTGLLSSEESDRIFRLRLIFDKATDFFEGDKAAAREWLNRPAQALGGNRPIALLINEAGVREVESLLSRLEYGVFT